MRVYISGAITGTKDYMERFSKAEEMIRNSGYVPVNPAKVNAQMPDGTKYGTYMEMSHVMLKSCDVVYMLNGWERSNGARSEFALAIVHKKTIVFEEV